MKILHLTLKKKWFDMIASGEKKEEYREIKWYWVRRLTTIGLFHRSVRYEFCNSLMDKMIPVATTLKQGNCNFSKYDFVCFRNGYHKKAREIIVKCNGILIGEGIPEWGAIKGEDYFVIKLGSIIL